MVCEIRCGNILGGIPRYISSPRPTWCSWHLARMSCHTGTAAVLAKRPCSANGPTALQHYLKQLPVPTRNLSLSAGSEPADPQGAQQAQPSTTLAPIARGTPFPTQQSCQELQADEYAIQAAFASPCITRRFSGGLFLAACATLGCYDALLPISWGQAQARSPPAVNLPMCSASLDGQLASALTRAVYSTVVQLQVMDEADFQRESFKLREREYKYYSEANRTQLPRLPDLSDNTGGMSNPSYFNFISYCLWKVVYRHVSDATKREAFARGVAAHLLSTLELQQREQGSPMQLRTQTDGKMDSAMVATLVEVARTTGPESEAARMVCNVVLPFLELLIAGGYICRFQLVLGSHPGTWPQDWMVSQSAVMVVKASDSLDSYDSDKAAEKVPEGDSVMALSRLTVAGTSSAGQTSQGREREGASDKGSNSDDGGDDAGEFLFQLKLHRPVDILGSVALRSEEDGAWPRTVSRCLLQLLAHRGYVSTETVEEGATARDEEDGRQQGVGVLGFAECDEFFYQDEWQGPQRWTDRLLLLLGDPLEQVGVDFVPSTLVQNWRLLGPGMRGTRTA